MGGLFRLDSTVAARDVELPVSLDAVVEARVVLFHVVGRRAPTVVVSLVDEWYAFPLLYSPLQLATMAARTIAEDACTSDCLVPPCSRLRLFDNWCPCWYYLSVIVVRISPVSILPSPSVSSVISKYCFRPLWSSNIARKPDGLMVFETSTYYSSIVSCDVVIECAQVFSRGDEGPEEATEFVV